LATHRPVKFVLHGASAYEEVKVLKQCQRASPGTVVGPQLPGRTEWTKWERDFATFWADTGPHDHTYGNVIPEDFVGKLAGLWNQ
jgi:hypothetical protein